MSRRINGDGRRRASLRPAAAAATLAAALMFTLAASREGAAGAGPSVLAFDGDAAGKAPPGFSFGRTGSGAAGRWEVKAEPGAPSGGNVLAQLDADDTDYRFPVAVADAPSFADGVVSVKCKPVSGKVDQACGLVMRFKDADNYYLTRANALEDNVRFYFVKDGKRKQVASWKGKVASGAWHDLRMEAHGDHFVVTFDGAKVLDAHDKTFSAAGKAGVWTKADSVTYFDDLSLTAM